MQKCVDALLFKLGSVAPPLAELFALLQTTLVSQAPTDLMLTLVESLVLLAISFCFEVMRSFERVLMDFWDDFEF